MTFFPLLAAAAAGPLSPRTPAADDTAKTATPVLVTVQPGARQRFAGLGTSLGNWGGEYQTLDAGQRAHLSRLLWRDLKMKTLRLWMNTFEFAPTPGAHDLAVFRKNYVDSGILRDARKGGVTTLLLAPDGLPAFMTLALPGGGRVFKPGEEANYAALLADFIERLRSETGMLLDATGIQNEPNDNEAFSKEQIVAVVKRLRTELDRRGLRSVRIIAPENANVDNVFYETLDLLKRDRTAWNALDGIASHSYTMAATEQAARRIEGTNKTYWMTEASDNGPEAPGDARRAASLAHRFLSDMNHRTTHWVHFLGFEIADPKDNATRIFAYTVRPFTLVTFQKYYYYRQLANTFDVGATFRKSVSSLDGDMTWTYGKKPRVTVAAARNPDGSWAVGVSNYTSPEFSDALQTERGETNQNGHAARTFAVTVRVPELARAGSVPLRVRRSGPGTNDADAGAVILRNGEVTLFVGPLELVTLRSNHVPLGKK